MVSLLTLPVLTICIFSGQKLMWVLLSLENLTDYSIYFGKLVKQTQGVMEYVTLKIDDLVSRLWQVRKQLMLLLSRVIQDLVSYQSLVGTLKRCLQIRLYQYLLITRFSLNRFRMVWIDQRLNLRIGFRLKSLLVKNFRRMNNLKKL